MKLLDVLTSPWSICPEKLAEIRNIYQAHMRGPKIDWKAIEAQVLLLSGDKPEEQYQVMNGVAVIPVKGVLTKGMSFFSFLFGGSSMKQIGMAFDAALNDPLVKSILLDIDSPGGTVDGTDELAQQIYQARGRKPIIAYSDGTMTSAAFWLASAADYVYISGDTVQTGSISVVATHIDQSKYDEAMGERWTEITSGRFKRIASSHRPLTTEGENYIQNEVNYLHRVFVETSLITYRGMDSEDAMNVSEGKVYIGKQAIEVGLVDGVEAFSDLINSAGVTAQQKSSKEEMDMNYEELKTKHADLFAQALAEGKAAGVAEGAASAKTAGIEEGKALGATAERQRIADVRAQLMPGHEALIDTLIMDGKTTGPEAAVKVLAAEKVIRKTKADAFKADGQLDVANPPAPDPAAEAAAAAAAKAAQGKDFMAEVDKVINEKHVGRGTAVSIVAKENPKLHEAFLAGLKPGKEE